MRKLILMAVATYFWNKFRDRNGPRTATGRPTRR